MKPFLILQLRPEDEASDGEFAAFLEKGAMDAARVERVRLERDPLPSVSLADYAGIIVGGGPGCVSDAPEGKRPEEARAEEAIFSLMPEVLERDMPFLGCCYGMGILAKQLGGEVSKERYGEPVGPVACEVTEAGANDPLLAGLPRTFDAFVGHKEAAQAVPSGAVHLMSSGPCPVQMIRAGNNVYATQFHPEADGEVFAERIRIYRDRGYFPPQDAETLTATCRAADVRQPVEILRRFVARYG